MLLHAEEVWPFETATCIRITNEQKYRIEVEHDIYTDLDFDV